MEESEWMWGCQVALRQFGWGRNYEFKVKSASMIVFFFSCTCVQYGAGRKLY